LVSLNELLLLPLDIIALCAAIGSGYYATRMIFYMRKGRMERAWKYLTSGAIFIIVGSVFFSITDIVPAYGTAYLISDNLGTGIMSGGFILLLLGFRSLYRVWTLKDLVKERERKQKNAITN
jgi:hypothetical protein